MTKPHNPRRRFIKNLGLVTVSLSGFSKKLFSAQKKNAATGIWEDIIDYARWCPTVHNLQPHKVKILSADEAILYYDSTRLLPVEDPTCRFCTVAMGIFIEHLTIAAGIYNLKVDFTDAHPISLNHKGIVPFAKLKLIPAENKEAIDRENIKKRRTSRLHYQGGTVDANILAGLKSTASMFGHHFYSTSDKAVIDNIIDLNRKTLFEDLEDDYTRAELNGLFRYNQHQAETKKDGLWSVCMNFPGWLMKSVFHHYEQWDHGFKRTLINDFYRSSFHGTSTMGWFAGGFADTADWLAAGRMLARNWLYLTAENIYIQPFGSLITNEHAYAAMIEKFDLKTPDKQLWMIFRLGHSKEPARSYRLDLKDILI